MHPTWFSIDWLHLREFGVYPNPVNDGYIVHLDRNLEPIRDEDGNVEKLITKSMRWRGSHDDSAILRVTDTVKRVDWNPAKYKRREAVTGVSIENAISITNELLADPQFKQTPFIAGERHRYQLDRATWATGAVARRIDINTMIVCGSEKAALELIGVLGNLRLIQRSPPKRYATAVTHGRAKKRGKYFKAYCKGPELKVRLREQLQEAKKTGVPIPDADITYLRALANFCTRMGIVRLEWELGDKYLKKHGLHDMVDLTSANVERWLIHEMEHLIGLMETKRDYSTISSSALSAYYLHRQGEVLDKVLKPVRDREGNTRYVPRYSKAMLYRYAKEIRDNFNGYDIMNRNPDHETDDAPTQRDFVAPQLLLAMPPWYRYAESDPRYREDAHEFESPEYGFYPEVE